jgi:predicted RNase H-like HicB family nuclease
MLGALSECGVSYPQERRMNLEFTAVFRKVPEGYIGFVEELPGANTQGATLEEVRANLKEAVELVLAANRMLAQEDASGADVIRERLNVTA